MSTAMPTVTLTLILDQVAKEKGVEREVLVRTLEQAIHQAALRTFGPTRNIEASFNEEKAVVEVFQTLTVVESLSDNPDERVNQISIDAIAEKGIEAEPGDELLFQIFYREEDAEQAREQDDRYGDILNLKTYRRGFGRIAAQAAKQVITQGVRSAEREMVFNEYISCKGEIVQGSVRRLDHGNIIIDLGRAEAVLPIREQIPGENGRRGASEPQRDAAGRERLDRTLRPSDKVQAYVMDVLREAKGPQVVLSRTANEFLIKLFEKQVPEIEDRIVVIEAAAREPGRRAKIAVSSNDSEVDPVGTCVGQKGARVQAVVQELRGEKIDIVLWDEDPARFVCNALSPAEVARVIVDDASRSMEIIVPDDQLSIAIGNRGQNVRLASQLTGWKLEILSETKVKEMRAFAERSFAAIGLPSMAADILYGHGFHRAEALLDANPELLAQIAGVTLEGVPELLRRAKAQASLDSAELSRLEAEREAARMAEQNRHPDTLTSAERLMRVQGLSEHDIEKLARAGLESIEKLLAEKDNNRLATVLEVSVKKITSIRMSAQRYLADEDRRRREMGPLRVAEAPVAQ